MIDRKALLSDLQSLLRTLEADLLERTEAADAPAEIGEYLQSEHKKARDADRTAQNFEDWRSDFITQVAAAWVLSCVFARFLEDNELVDPPMLSGPGERLQRARDEREVYFRDHPTETDREYLLTVFDGLAKLPGSEEIFGEHNPVHELRNWLSGDAASELLGFFQKIDADTGDLVHDFTDPEWNTRFLGDLYQDLSEAARKKYALLQTPDFVEEFILDRTLDSALDEFGLTPPAVKNEDGDEIAPAGFRMIDPACGSGHFLLGAFKRIVNRWRKQDPGAKDRELVQRALDSVCGVDVNPFAIAIARFRLLLAALQESGIARLKDAPDYHFNLAAGDSLLHGVPGSQAVMAFDELSHHYAAEDADRLRRMLRPGSYHAVVANPPYINVKDRSLNVAYRERFSTCHMKYSLSVPFMQRIFGLLILGRQDTGSLAGYCGQITSNSFMKREFGKRLINEFLCAIDLTHIVDTSGVYLPGHGTPTVILLGRNREPLGTTIRCVMGIKGEPSSPADPSQGVVWQAIAKNCDRPGTSDEYVSVSDSPRDQFARHPWSLGGGTATDLLTAIEAHASTTVGAIAETVGYAAIAGIDDAFIADSDRTWRRHGIAGESIRPFGVGDSVRDWVIQNLPHAIYPHADDGGYLQRPDAEQHFWVLRTSLRSMLFFGKTQEERGRNWRSFAVVVQDKLFRQDGILFSFVSTHNHFAYDSDGVIAGKSSPCIKLPLSAESTAHNSLLGVLNSSLVCFWIRMTASDKGMSSGIVEEQFERFFMISGTVVSKIPVPQSFSSELPCAQAKAARRLRSSIPQFAADQVAPTRDDLCSLKTEFDSAMNTMVSLQEEMDWLTYRAYGILDNQNAEGIDAPPIALGERAFEIAIARKMASGDLQTEWFRRHSSTPITELPAHWPEAYKKVVEHRISLIETNKDIGLIEQPEYKRRWNTESWKSMEERALRGWLLDRLESYFDFDGRMNDEGRATAKIDIGVISLARLADIAQADDQFHEVGSLLTHDPAFGVLDLVIDLVRAESVPLLPKHRYKPSGLRKRSEWEKKSGRFSGPRTRSTPARNCPRVTPSGSRPTKRSD